MAKRKKTLVDILLDLFEAMLPLYVIYLALLWFTNKAKFWYWVIYGILYLFAVVVIVIWRKKSRFKAGEKWRSDQDLIRWLRGMHPSEFEEYIADLFGRLGYKTQATGGSHDEGIDVIAEKDGVKHYIQCKKYFSKHQVGSPEVREFWGAVAHHLGNGEGWFITTNKFTPEAEKFAEDKPIVLINQFELVKYIHLAEKQGFDSKPQTQINLKCPQCGGGLIERSGKFGKFLGCSNYPKCQYTENIKK